ncbi:MAG: hypothetical protein KDA42_03405 [Planctomycetales bacterium]|nr:hypothetical protein [Planctomycetales bacterium]
MAFPMEDPYDIIRRRIANVLFLGVALAEVILIGDAFFAIGRFPYFSAVFVGIALIVMAALIVFARFLLAGRAAADKRLFWLWHATAALSIYALLFYFGLLPLAQAVLYLWLAMTAMSHWSAPIAETTRQVALLCASRLGVLLLFLLWQTFWSPIFISPGVTILVNFAVTGVVAWQLGRAQSAAVCYLACSSAFALTAVLTFAAPFVTAIFVGVVQQLVMLLVAIVSGAVVGFLFGAASHAAAEPIRRRYLELAYDERVHLGHDAFEQQLRSAGAIQRVRTADNRAREEIDPHCALPVVQQALAQHDAGWREAAADVLQSLEASASAQVDRLLETVADPDQPDVEGQIRDSLCRLAPRAASRLAAALEHPSEAVRAAAVYALREAGEAARPAMASVRKALADESASVRQRAAGTLARLAASDEETLAALEVAASDANLSVRLAAEKALRELRR